LGSPVAGASRIHIDLIIEPRWSQLDQRRKQGVAAARSLGYGPQSAPRTSREPIGAGTQGWYAKPNRFFAGPCFTWFLSLIRQLAEREGFEPRLTSS
jgi:hypothetical protein